MKREHIEAFNDELELMGIHYRLPLFWNEKKDPPGGRLRIEMPAAERRGNESYAADVSYSPEDGFKMQQVYLSLDASTEAMTHAHTFRMGEGQLTYTMTEMRALMQGRSVYKVFPGSEQSAWTRLEQADDGGLQVRQLAQHYNYDLMKVIEQLPLEHGFDLHKQRALEYKLRSGESVRLTIMKAGEPLVLQVHADPLNRSIVMRQDMDGRPVTFQDLGVAPAEPKDIEHYKLFVNGRLVTNSNSYRDMQAWALKINDPLLVVGKLEGKTPLLDENGRLVPGTGVLVMSRNHRQGIIRFLENHIQPADIVSPMEKDLRAVFKSYPTLPDDAYEKGFQAFRQQVSGNEAVMIDQVVSQLKNTSLLPVQQAREAVPSKKNVKGLRL